MPKKYIITNINNVNPTPNNDTTAGYSLAQNWFNETSGELFYHKASGVWVSYASTNSVGESPVMFADVATTTQFNGTYTNGVGGVGATLIRTTNGILDVDNVRLNLGVVVLVKDQPEGDIDFGTPNLQYQNGVYVVTQAGTSVAPVILTRVDFADASDELFPSQVNILDGTVNQNKFFLQETENPTIGSSSIVYTTNLIPPTPQVILPVVFVDTATTEPLPSCTYTNIYDPVIIGQPWYSPFPIDATITATANGPLGTINGVVMGNTVANRNNRILVKNQVNPAHNGDYRVVNAGSATTPWVLQRITKNGGSMITSVREWKVNNENSTLYGNRYNLNSDLRFFKLGLASLEFLEISSSLGLIRIVDLLGEKFTDLATARAYVKTFTSAVISDESFNDGVYYFTVPPGSNFDLTGNFLNNTSAHIIDECGLIDSFGNSAFQLNTGNNILGNCLFGNSAFDTAAGNNVLKDCTFGATAFGGSTGNNNLRDCTFGDSAFVFSTGNNILGNCPSFGNGVFAQSTGNNVLGNCNNFGFNAFYQSEGDNVLGDCPVFGVNAFSLSTGNNTLGDCAFGQNAFKSSTGNNTLGNCTGFGINAFNLSTGNNVLGNCNFSNDAFGVSEGDNQLGNCTFSDTAFNLSTGNNVLGNCTFGNNAFSDSTGNNVLGNCPSFGYQAFIQSTGDNILGDCPVFGYNAFKSSTGNNVLGNCTFGDSAFSSSTGNNRLGDCTFGLSGFAFATGNNGLRDCAFGTSAFSGSTGNNSLRDCSFGNGSFQTSSGYNTLGNCTFLDYAFNGSSGAAALGDCTFGNYAFYNSTGNNSLKNILLSLSTYFFARGTQGRFELYGNIGTDETANYPNFFTNSTAVIWANKSKETSNSGQLEGDLATALTNGAKLFFGYVPSYKVYTALLSQAGSANPTATVLDNTLGTITFARGITGNYSVNLNGSPLSTVVNMNKTIVFISAIDVNNFTIFAKGDDIITRNAGVSTDSVLSSTSYEIRVYN